jgi:release factor glutamine methyltransferase
VKRHAALLQLLHFLRLYAYQFTTVTPATHECVLSSECTGPLTLRDIFGWNRPFGPDDIAPVLLQLLEQADVLASDASGKLVCRIRVASLDDQLFIHSGYPTEQKDAVFFGPDTYRFVQFVKRHLPSLPSPRRIVDMGAGCGSGGIAVSALFPDAKISLVDVNPKALFLAEVNAAAAGAAVETRCSDRLPEGADLVIANPPYLMDPSERQYRHGGELLGGAIALDWVHQALDQLAPEGTMLLYTGAAFVDGRSPLLVALRSDCNAAGAQITVEEIDPDVFGEELSGEEYRNVERIAAVGVRVTR